MDRPDLSTSLMIPSFSAVEQRISFPTRSPSQVHFFEYAVLQRQLSHQLFDLIILPTQSDYLIACSLPLRIAD